MTRGYLAVGAVVMVAMRTASAQSALRGGPLAAQHSAQMKMGPEMQRILHEKHSESSYSKSSDSGSSDSKSSDSGSSDSKSSDSGSKDDDYDGDDGDDYYGTGDDGSTSTESEFMSGVPRDPFDYVGCYGFSGEGLSLNSPIDSDDMDPQMCFEHCSMKGAAFMATQWGRVCWCGWDEEIDTYIKEGKGMCTLPCSGDADETCGGPWSFDLYRIVAEGSGDVSLSPTSAPTSAPTATPTSSLDIDATMAPVSSTTSASTTIATPTPSTVQTPKPTTVVVPMPTFVTPAPVTAPTSMPATTPNPVTPPTPTPVTPATTAPMAPPTSPPVAPQTEPPVAPPTERPTAPAPVGLDAEMKELLDLHNAVRCMHGAVPLSWSSTVASVATAYAAKLTTDSMCGQLEHSSREERNGYGENLHMCWGSSPGCYSSEDAVFGFYDEEVSGGPVTGYGGHATQMLWKSTKELGCAVAACSKSGSNYNILVCNYDPPGNYQGRYEEEVETPSRSAAECGYA